MDATPRHRPRAVLGLAGMIAAALPAPAAAAAAAPSRWEVTVAVRLSGGTGAPVDVRLALPADSPTQRVTDVAVTGRGLKTAVERDGPTPHVRWHGKLKGARRVAVRYVVERRRLLTAMPAIGPLDAPPAALLPYLTPSPLLQSRSLLVREFLEANVTPMLAADQHADLLRAIYRATRAHLTWRADGKSLTLDVIRSGGGKRIGIERAFATFLRCARVPARVVEGIDLDSSTSRKRVFWTEAWARDQWWPVSASSGWVGRAPKSYIALARDGTRVLAVDGPVEATYSVHAVAVENPADE